MQKSPRAAIVAADRTFRDKNLADGNISSADDFMTCASIRGQDASQRINIADPNSRRNLNYGI